MSRSSSSFAVRVAALAGALVLLAACGNKGDLVRPPAEPAKAPAPVSTDSGTGK